MRLRSPEKDTGPGNQSVVESLRELSSMFPPNMIVIVFCTSPDSMYPGNLTRTVLERGRLSARSADSSLPPNPAEKTRIRTSSGAEGGYLGAVRWEVSGSCPHWACSMGTPALEGIIDKGAAMKIGDAKAHWPNIGWHIPAWGPDCETGRRRAHLCSGDARVGESPSRPAPWFRTIRDVKAAPSGVVGRTTINYHGFCRGAPEELVPSGVSGKRFALYGAL